MPPRTYLLKALTLVLPAGALGASALLAASASLASTEPSTAPQPQSAADASVAERLHLIRSGVAELAQNGPGSIAPEGPPGGRATPAWWANGPGWGNGPNWANAPAWGNAPSWGNGAAWGNGWPNMGWHNWGNGYADATKFWPIYDKYTTELVSTNNKKYAAIQEYADKFGTLTDDQAIALTKQVQEVDIAAAQLRAKYLPIVAQAIGGKKAATFWQIDRRITDMIDLQLGARMPLVQSQGQSH